MLSTLRDIVTGDLARLVFPGGRSEPTQDAVQQMVLTMQSQGFVVLKEQLSPREVDQTIGFIESEVFKLPGMGIRLENGLTFGEDLLKHHPLLSQGVLSNAGRNLRLPPLVRAVISGYLLDESPEIGEAFVKFRHPGVERQAFHVDPEDYAVQSGECILVGIFLGDYDSHNGGTIIRPGTHRLPPPSEEDAYEDDPGRGTRRVRTYDDEITLSGKAGDILVLDSRCWHCGGGYSRTAEAQLSRKAVFSLVLSNRFLNSHPELADTVPLSALRR